MKITAVMLGLLFPLFLVSLSTREKQLRIERKALDIGVYDYSKVKKCPCKIYYDREAEDKFLEVLMRREKLLNSNIFGLYVKRENDSLVFERENEAYEYCPKLNYVIESGGHGFVSAYDLETLEEIFVNPSTFVYSPSGNYRFGSFEADGTRYYLEIKEGEKWTSHPFADGAIIEGAYWIDNETMYYLEEKEKPDGFKYWIGYSMRLYFEDNMREVGR